MAELHVDKKNPILKKTRTSCGIADLDLLLEGGYQKEGLVMLAGPTGAQKNAFAFHFAQAGLAENELIVYITADMGNEELLKKASMLGFEFKKQMDAGNFMFIDCYSSTLDSMKKMENTREVISLSGATALNDLSIAIKTILQDNEQRNIRVVFHSLSTFILYNPANSIIKFIQLVGGRLKKGRATTLFIVDEGMHEKTLLTSIEHMMDEKYSITDGENFSINSSLLPMPVPLKLGTAGIELR